MMELRQIVFLLFVTGFFCNAFGDLSAHECEKVKEKFQNTTTAFIACSIQNAEPVHYCQNCGINYADVIIDYNQLLTTLIPNKNETCKSKYIGLDRLNLLETILASTTSLWEAGSCSNCYDWTDGSHQQNKSKSTLEFFNGLETFDNCSSTNISDQICLRCLDAYNRVNDLYNTIKEETQDKICFDIKDAMNKTRLHWSRDLNCCKDRKSSLTAFIATSTIIGCLIPFVFYSGFMFVGFRRRQHEFLMDSEPQTSARVQPSVSAVNREEYSSTSNRYITNGTSTIH